MSTGSSADERLVASFLALGNMNRLAILRALRTPRTLGEIVVRNDGVGAPLARQTVRRHLDELLEIGLVEAREANDENARDYLVNHLRLYALSEDVRALALLRPAVEPEAVTATVLPGGAPRARGPCLVLTKGLGEGRRFDLRPEGVARWTIGRRRTADIALDFDSATSSENAEVRWDDHAHHLVDLPGSKNGTTLNFEKLEPGRETRLRHGDIIGVGRCLLVYWE